MGWLDASEYFLMEAIARDRVEHLRSTIDVASAEGADETPRDIPEAGRALPRRGAVGLPVCRRAATAGV
jgi:hypothetical protein